MLPATNRGCWGSQPTCDCQAGPPIGSPPDVDPVTTRGPEVEQFLGLLGVFHGLTSLEVNHHLDWTDAPSVFERRVRWAIAALDLPAARPDTVRRFERAASTVIP